MVDIFVLSVTRAIALGNRVYAPFCGAGVSPASKNAGGTPAPQRTCPTCDCPGLSPNRADFDCWLRDESLIFPYGHHHRAPHRARPAAIAETGPRRPDSAPMEIRHCRL